MRERSAIETRRYLTQKPLEKLCTETKIDNAIRVSPPLVITRGEIDWALDQFDAALSHPEAA